MSLFVQTHFTYPFMSMDTGLLTAFGYCAAGKVGYKYVFETVLSIILCVYQEQIAENVAVLFLMFLSISLSLIFLVVALRLT